MCPYRAICTGTHEQHVQICHIPSLLVFWEALHCPRHSPDSLASRPRSNMALIYLLLPTVIYYTSRIINLVFPEWGQQGHWGDFLCPYFSSMRISFRNCNVTCCFHCEFFSEVGCLVCAHAPTLFCMLHLRLTWIASPMLNWTWTNDRKSINSLKVSVNPYSILCTEWKWPSPVCDSRAQCSFSGSFCDFRWSWFCGWDGVESYPDGHMDSYVTLDELHMPGLNIPQYCD